MNWPRVSAYAPLIRSSRRSVSRCEPLIRALARYRQQSGLDPTQRAQEEALSNNPGVTRLILDLFRTKFDPAIKVSVEQRKQQAEAVFGEIVAALQQVASATSAPRFAASATARALPSRARCALRSPAST